MKASDFTRDDCKVGNRRRTYATLQRDYRCNVCGGRLTTKCNDMDEWFIACAACGAQDFVHEVQLMRERQEAAQVLDGLPAELITQLTGKEN